MREHYGLAAAVFTSGFGTLARAASSVCPEFAQA